jgi:glycine C-acetyltransferase
MITANVKTIFQNELKQIKSSGLFKSERILESPQDATITTANHEVINFCANNYLGLANHPGLKAAAEAALADFGYGLSSVRFICGTQTIHKTLEQKISEFLGFEDTILYSSCFDANGGLFETLLTKEDAIISDTLNHASIIDGIRLCKAARFRYQNNDHKDLETQLKSAQNARIKLIATDGVFSMDGTIANLKGICDLAEKYEALVMVDDSHATGFVGKQGKGTPEHCGVEGRVDLMTSTFGKALGGASGGFTTGSEDIITLLRQRSRPYLFSNSLAPVITAATHTALKLVQNAADLRKRLSENTHFFRTQMTKAGFDIVKGTHPIVPVMIYDATKATQLANALLEKDIYVIAFSYPVVPKEKARIRVQLSAAHTQDQLDHALEAFIFCARQLKIIN